MADNTSLEFYPKGTISKLTQKAGVDPISPVEKYRDNAGLEMEGFAAGTHDSLIEKVRKLGLLDTEDTNVRPVTKGTSGSTR